MKVKTICCIGAGYVGGPTMAVIALKCPHINVYVVDINQTKIDLWNDENLDNIPVYEPGLKEIVSKTRNKNLFFSTDINLAINKSEMIFVAVNTPTKTYGEGKGMAADLTYVENCAKTIGQLATSDKIVIEKSTLPVRTAEKIKEILKVNSREDVNFEVLSNPEFLAEGTAIKDLFKSDRVLIGSDQTKSGLLASQSLVEIYKNWIPKEKILTTNVWSSELTKLASNAMLAQRISSINSLSALCEKTGADIEEVSNAIGFDKRIGKEFLKSSVGFGGSCFQKDILNLVYLSKYYGLDEVADFWYQVIKINNYQKVRFSKKIIDELNGTIKSKKIAVLGWAFKKDTNDSRESASIYVTDHLLEEGAQVCVYDPKVEEEQMINDLYNLWESKNISKSEIESKLNRLTVTHAHEDCFNSSSCIAVLTEWDEFITYDWNSLIKNMEKQHVIIDGRNILDRDKISRVANKFIAIGK
jgi:UDPglucose 6-dehydrogenase